MNNHHLRLILRALLALIKDHLNRYPQGGVYLDLQEIKKDIEEELEPFPGAFSFGGPIKSPEDM